ncbi:MAG: hypothetical protein GX256_05395 [Fretibacterium sp.]|nr:hypothetical protein [Fretibacterium sp.]
MSDALLFVQVSTAGKNLPDGSGGALGRASEATPAVERPFDSLLHSLSQSSPGSQAQAQENPSDPESAVAANPLSSLIASLKRLLQGEAQVDPALLPEAVEENVAALLEEEEPEAEKNVLPGLFALPVSEPAGMAELTDLLMKEAPSEALAQLTAMLEPALEEMPSPLVGETETESLIPEAMLPETGELGDFGPLADVEDSLPEDGGPVVISQGELPLEESALLKDAEGDLSESAQLFVPSELAASAAVTGATETAQKKASSTDAPLPAQKPSDFEGLTSREGERAVLDVLERAPQPSEGHEPGGGQGGFGELSEGKNDGNKKQVSVKTASEEVSDKTDKADRAYRKDHSSEPARTEDRTERSPFQVFFEGVRARLQSEPTSPLALARGLPMEQAETLREGLDNVVRFVRLSGGQRASLIVDPPALGRLSVELTTTSAGIEAAIKVSSEQVRQLIQEQLVQLRSTLAQQGVQLAHFSVDVQQEGERRQSFEQESGRTARRRRGVEPAEEEAALFRVDLDQGLLHWVA